MFRLSLISSAGAWLALRTDSGNLAPNVLQDVDEGSQEATHEVGVTSEEEVTRAENKTIEVEVTQAVTRTENVTRQFNATVNQTTYKIHTLVGKDSDVEAAKMNIGLRCCSDSDTKCTSWLQSGVSTPWQCNRHENATNGAVTFKQAQDFCKGVGQTLCSAAMPCFVRLLQVAPEVTTHQSAPQDAKIADALITTEICGRRRNRDE